MRILILFIFLNSIAFGQGPEFNYDLTVKTTKGVPDIGRDVVFIETNTYERLTFKTNTSGKLSVVLDHGERWLGSVGDMRNCIDLETSHGGKATRTMTYNPASYERENQVLPDRRSIAFKKVDQQRISPAVEPSKTESVINIVLLDRNRRVYPKIDVSLVCFETQTIYTGRTNGNGGVTFKVPLNKNYEIDVDGVESLKWIDLGPTPMTQTMRIMFQPRTFKEEKDDRFIVQNVPTNVQPSSSHARVKMTVRKDGSNAINEDVYIRMLKSNKVYKAKTNDQGDVTFMLPIRNKYFVDFEFQRNADEIDLSHVKGIAFQEFSVNYVVDPRLSDIENFIPSVKDLVEYDIHNFVTKQYPEPVEGDMDFYLSWGNKFNENSKEALLEIGLKVKSKMTRKSTEPLNICFVVDKSGSMMGEDRIGQLKNSLIQFVSQLDKTDVVSIVVFDDQATLAVPPEKLGDKKKIIDIIHAIQADGGTNIYDGMVLGFEQVKKQKVATTINRLILLTDGFGSQPPETVIAKAKEYIKGGTELSAVGVGVDYNQVLLSQLASAGGGLLHLAGTSANIQEVFQRELESILYPMAKKATLTVSYNDQIIYRQLYGYSNEKVTDGKMNVDIPNLFPGLDQLALIKFDLINATKAIENQAVKVKLEYTDAITGKNVIREKKIHPEWTTATGELDMAIDIEHKKVMAVAIANQSLKNMANSFESGNRDAAYKAVKSSIEQIQHLFPNAQPEELLAVMDRLREYVEAFEILKAHSDY